MTYSLHFIIVKRCTALVQAMIHDMLSKLQEQQAQDSRRDAWCKAELANTRESKAGDFEGPSSETWLVTA